MSGYEKSPELAALGLGGPTEYLSEYAPELLQAVPRALNRGELGIVDQQPFYGCDVWHGYELSWLNHKGKPVVALMRCFVPATTPNIIESKSFKLYLNSFNQSRFGSHRDVETRLVADLSATAGGDVRVSLFQPDDLQGLSLTTLPGICIDDLDLTVDQYALTGFDTHETGNKSNEIQSPPQREILHSHLLKSNCLITNQPDWASVVIDYKGQQIDHESLLRYLISFRMHNEFHEQCVERIYMDLWRAHRLERLSVQALYTRRGGLDINPYRSSEKDRNSEKGSQPPLYRINRQ